MEKNLADEIRIIKSECRKKIIHARDWVPPWGLPIAWY